MSGCVAKITRPADAGHDRTRHGVVGEIREQVQHRAVVESPSRRRNAPPRLRACTQRPGADLRDERHDVALPDGEQAPIMLEPVRVRAGSSSALQSRCAAAKVSRGGRVGQVAPPRANPRSARTRACGLRAPSRRAPARSRRSTETARRAPLLAHEQHRRRGASSSKRDRRAQRRRIVDERANALAEARDCRSGRGSAGRSRRPSAADARWARRAAGRPRCADGSPW